MYKLRLKENIVGFSMSNIYTGKRDIYDSKSINYFIIKRDDGEQMVVHSKYFEVIGLNE
jgi:hypothetical protein